MKVQHSHSQLALLGSYSWIVSIDLLPCEDCKITVGSTPNSLPILKTSVSMLNIPSYGTCGKEDSHLCQCLTIASVESTIVPSISNRTPLKEWVSGRPVKPGLSSNDDMLIVPILKLFLGWTDVAMSQVKK